MQKFWNAYQALRSLQERQTFRQSGSQAFANQIIKANMEYVFFYSISSELVRHG